MVKWESDDYIFPVSTRGQNDFKLWLPEKLESIRSPEPYYRVPKV